MNPTPTFIYPYRPRMKSPTENETQTAIDKAFESYKADRQFTATGIAMITAAGQSAANRNYSDRQDWLSAVRNAVRQACNSYGS